MYKKILVMITLLLLSLVITIGAVSANEQDLRRGNQGIDSTGIILEEVFTEPSDRDRDWPVVYSEKYEWLDEETQEPHIGGVIVRRSNSLDVMHGMALCSDQTFTQSDSVQSSCTPAGGITVQRYDSLSGVFSFVKHHADVYCNGPDCTLYDPFKAERWWTRANSNWSVQNATMQWGCGACTQCPLGDWSYIYNWGPVTPGWNPNNTSYVYTTTIYWWPIIDDAAYGSDISAIVHSDGYEGPTYRGHMVANATLP